jgi:hypothetical protein
MATLDLAQPRPTDADTSGERCLGHAPSAPGVPDQASERPGDRGGLTMTRDLDVGA